MHLIKLLLDNAVQDNQVLVQNREIGDRTEMARDIEFVLYAKTEERAKLAANFIADNRYGRPALEEIERDGGNSWQLLVTIHAPATENVLHTLSAFMVCLSQLYDLDYDGWSSDIKR